MSPKKPNIRLVPYRFNLRKRFPNGYEVATFPITDERDYYAVFYDAEEGGMPNPSANWIAPYLGVAPTGNFIVMRKKWIDGEEEAFDMDITPKQFKKWFLQRKID